MTIYPESFMNHNGHIVSKAEGTVREAGQRSLCSHCQVTLPTLVAAFREAGEGSLCLLCQVSLSGLPL